MDCVFKLSKDGKMWLGVHCSHSTPVVGPAPPKRNCKQTKSKAQCQSLGEYLSMQECETCVGKTHIKLFSCDIHGEATIGKKLEGIACCGIGGVCQCPEYAPSKRAENPDDGRGG